MNFTGGTEEFKNYLTTNNYQQVNVNKTDNHYFTNRETGSQVKVDEYSGRITLINKFGYKTLSQRVVDKETMDKHTYNT